MSPVGRAGRQQILTMTGHGSNVSIPALVGPRCNPPGARDPEPPLERRQVQYPGLRGQPAPSKAACTSLPALGQLWVKPCNSALAALPGDRLVAYARAGLQVS